MEDFPSSSLRCLIKTEAAAATAAAAAAAAAPHLINAQPLRPLLSLHLPSAPAAVINSGSTKDTCCGSEIRQPSGGSPADLQRAAATECVDDHRPTSR